MEVINQKEGSLVWVQASAPASTAWNTASAPASGVLGFVESFSLSSARTVATQMDRGLPKHHKEASREAPELQVTYRWTGYGIGIVSADGATMQMANLEFRGAQAHLGTTPTGRYFQFYGAALVSRNWSEGAEFDQVQETWRLLGYSGENATGFMGNHTV